VIDEASVVADEQDRPVELVQGGLHLLDGR
jgi:hypothetical protein